MLASRIVDKKPSLGFLRAGKSKTIVEAFRSPVNIYS